MFIRSNISYTILYTGEPGKQDRVTCINEIIRKISPLVTVQNQLGTVGVIRFYFVYYILLLGKTVPLWRNKFVAIAV